MQASKAYQIPPELPSASRGGARGLWFCFWLILLGWPAAPAAAVVFPLEVGLTGQSGDRLEVAADDAFKELILQSRIGQQTTYLVNLEKTGRYVYRILRDGKELERDAFFVALEAPPPERLYRARWKAVEGDVSFRISFTRVNGLKSWVVSSTPLVYLGGRGVPWLLRIRAVRPGVPGSQPIAELDVQVTVPPPSVRVAEPLKATTEPKESAAAAPPVLKLDPFAKDDDQIDAEPEYKDLLKGSEKRWWGDAATQGAKSQLKPLTRPHSVYSWLRGFKEGFKVDRRDRYESPESQGFGGGFGFAYFVQPTLRVGLDLDTHATKTSYEEGGTEPPASEQKRIRLLLGAGVDVLNLESRRENFSLLIGPSFGFLQLPVSEDEQKLGDIGLEINPSYYPWRLQAQLRYFKSGSSEAALHWTLPLAIWSLPAKKMGLRPFLAPYTRRTKAKDSSFDSTFNESGCRLGLDFSF